MHAFAKTLPRSLGFACLWLVASSAEAVSPRAYVSVNGNDGNTCNVPATPCRTFTGAIAQTTSGGEVIVMDSGTFGGGTISQAVTINAPSGVAALVATPIVVNAGANDVVTLRGVTFVAPSPGLNVGLTFNGGHSLNVENCVFHGWDDAMHFVAPGRLHVIDTTIRDNDGYGVLLTTASGSIQASVERTQFLNNSIGLRAGSRARVTIKDSLVSGSGNGLSATSFDGSDSEMTIDGCVATHNDSAIVASSSFSGPGIGTIRIGNSTITSNNGVGLFQVDSGVLFSRGNNIVEANTTNTYGTIGSITGK
jgi:hypothetical protein